jgi:hypothetical protein
LRGGQQWEAAGSSISPLPYFRIAKDGVFYLVAAKMQGPERHIVQSLPKQFQRLAAS